MKKLIALLLAAVMMLACTAALAEQTTITSEDGSFSLSFQLPENAKLISGDWIDDKNYMANLQTEDGLYFFLAVSAPVAGEEENKEELTPVTYNEENGYTDQYMEEMVKELFSDDSDQLEIGVMTTAHGTKLAVVRMNDETAPSAYIFTVWNDYEVGLTVVAENENGYTQVTDEQLDRVVDFISELWMNTKAAE